MASAAPDNRFSVTPPVVTSGNANLEIFRMGNGTAVLMHPPLGRQDRNFEDKGNRVVKAGYHVALISPLGIGGSNGPMENVDLRDLAGDIWAVAGQRKINPPLSSDSTLVTGLRVRLPTCTPIVSSTWC